MEAAETLVLELPALELKARLVDGRPHPPVVDPRLHRLRGLGPREGHGNAARRRLAFRVHDDVHRVLDAVGLEHPRDADILQRNAVHGEALVAPDVHEPLGLFHRDVLHRKVPYRRHAHLVRREFPPLVEDVGLDGHHAPAHLLRLHVLHADVLDEAAAPLVRLHVEEAERLALQNAVVHPDVAHAARHLAADPQEDVSVHDRAVPDLDVFARGAQAPRILVAPRLDDHRVIALVEAAILDEDVFRHLDVDAVVVVSVGVDVETAHNRAVAKKKVYRPERRLADPEALEPDIPAAVELDEMRPYVRLGDFRQVALVHRRVEAAPVV